MWPIEPDWTLVEPKQPSEKTRDKYRFAVQAKPDEPARLAIKEEQTVGQQIALTNADVNTILFYSNAQQVSEKVKAALAEIVKRKQAVEEVVAESRATPAATADDRRGTKPDSQEHG